MICLENSSIENIDLETLEEEEAIKESEEEFDPISDDEEGAIQENCSVFSAGDGTSRECMMSDVSPMHDTPERVDEEDDEGYKQNGEEATDDELLLPQIQQLCDRSQFIRGAGYLVVY